MQRYSRTAAAAALFAAALFAGTPAAQAADTPTPLTVDASFNPAALAGKAFQITDAKALKGMSRVAVPVFAVEFVTADNVTAHVSSFGNGGRASSSLYYKLLGVGEAEFQAMTDALYAELLGQLKASGLDVVPAAQLQAAPSYRKLAASGTPAPIKSDSAMVMSPAGMALYGFAKGSSNDGKSVFGAIASMGSGFAAVGAIGDTIELSKELNASLLEIRLRVNFVELSDDNKGFFGRLGSTATASSKVFPSVAGSMIGVQSGPWRSTLTAQNILVLDNAAFTEVREKATTTGDVVGAVALGLLQLAIGSKDNSKYKEMEAVADPANYPKVVASGIGQFSNLLVARLQAER